MWSWPISTSRVCENEAASPSPSQEKRAARSLRSLKRRGSQAPSILHGNRSFAMGSIHPRRRVGLSEFQEEVILATQVVPSA